MVPWFSKLAESSELAHLTSQVAPFLSVYLPPALVPPAAQLAFGVQGVVGAVVGAAAVELDVVVVVVVVTTWPKVEEEDVVTGSMAGTELDEEEVVVVVVLVVTAAAACVEVEEDELAGGAAPPALVARAILDM